MGGAMSAKNKRLGLREMAITQDLFVRMPALLTAFQVKMVTGLDDHELATEVKAGRLVKWEPAPRNGRKRSYGKYTKMSVGVLVGFKT